MNIIAFLQNPWFRPETSERHIIMYRDDQDFHRKVLSMSMTGKRLMEAFGNIYDAIHWDNTNWRPAWYAAGRVEPDYDHMTRVLHAAPRWDLILTFGKQAKLALLNIIEEMPNDSWKIYNKIPVMSCHHPNARHMTQADLREFALRVFERLTELSGGREDYLP